MSEAPELKPCPFCGNSPEKDLLASTLSQGFWVGVKHRKACIIKDLTHIWGKTEAEAMSTWNTRSDLAEIQGE